MMSLPRAILAFAVLTLAWAGAPLHAESPALPAESPAIPAASAHDAATDKSALLKLEQDWSEAVVRHDAAFIDRVELDSYIYTDAAGCVGRKADDLATARAGDVKIESFKLSDLKVQLHGDAAVVTGQTTVSGSDHGGSLTGAYRWTDVFVRTPAGAWKVAASQATAVSKAEEISVLTLPAETPAEMPAEMPAESPAAMPSESPALMPAESPAASPVMTDPANPGE